VCTVKKTPDDGQRNCPKHVEFYSKYKFEKLVHLVGFITSNFTKASFFFNFSDLKPNKTAISLNVLRNIYMPNITYERGPA